jgi:hypothetical protein
VLYFNDNGSCRSCLGTRAWRGSVRLTFLEFARFRFDRRGPSLFRRNQAGKPVLLPLGRTALDLLDEVLSPTNPFGIKAGGEGGCTPALAVVVSAILDALAPLGVHDITMPATPFKVWQAIRDTHTKSSPPAR